MTKLDEYELIKKNFKEIAEKVDNFILSNLSNDNNVPNLWESSKHYIIAGGKRLRPYFVIKSYELINNNYEDIIPIASAIEIMHTFSLIHDDIMDKDSIRRNVPTVHRKWNESIAILAGDLLLSQAFIFVINTQIPDEIKLKIILELGLVSTKLYEGQTMDINFEERWDVSVYEYMTMIKLKTGALFKTCLFIGGLCANASISQIEALKSYGENFGVAFQIMDDILGLIGEEKKLGKPIGSDLREKKKTYLLIYALEHLQSTEYEKLISLLSKKEKTEEDIRNGIDLIRKSGAIESAKKIVRNLLDEAISKMEVFPDSEAKKELQRLANFSIQRTN